MEHPLPDSVLDDDIAILGKKGGGKTFTAKGLVERLLDLKRRVLILDPLGVWAGLRTSADGTAAGYPIAIFGGLYGDLPLDPSAAEMLAKIIATENLPAVIDLSELSKSKQQNFLYAFLHELRTLNKEALTIVLEEADVFAPQNPQGDDSKQLHGEIDWIARRGRSRGFRLITITQRPARLAKDVLTQCATLIAHRLPAPQDRDAVKAWVDGNGDKEKAKAVFDTLAQLSVGQAWVYAPDQGLLETMIFPQIRTLDTSSTPKAGERRMEPKKLAEIDVTAIKAAMDAAKAEEEASKPKAKESGTPRAGSLQDLVAAEAKGYEAGYQQGYWDARQALCNMFSDRVQAVADGIRGNAGGLPGDIFVPDHDEPRGARPDVVAARKIVEGSIVLKGQSMGKTEAFMGRVEDTAKPRATGAEITASPFYQTAVSIWPAKMTWAGLGSLCHRKAHGGSFNSVRKRLVDEGHVVEQENLVLLCNPPQIPSDVQAVDFIQERLPTVPASIFKAIRANPGSTLEDIAASLGKAPHGGSWNTAVKLLKDSNFIQISGGKAFVCQYD